jgi:hypothetical protein
MANVNTTMASDVLKTVSSQPALGSLVEGNVQAPPVVFSLVRPLFTVVCCALLFLGGLIVACLFVSNQNYRTGISAAVTSGPPDHVALLSYSRAWDFAVVKFSTVFLAFGIILIGALYVLHKGEVGFHLSVDGPTGKGALNSSSPGLVMVALGVVLLIAALQTKSEVKYIPPGPAGNGPSENVKQMPPEKP